MVATFYPFLINFGYGLDRKEFIILSWGGIRGALGLTLSLMVGVDKTLRLHLRELCIFYMSGLTTLSLCINGTTS